MIEDFDFYNALITRDIRHISETRMKAIGEIEGRLFTVIYTMRGKIVRVISLRPASRIERNEYEA